MTSDTEPLWPYLFLAAGWSAVCAYMLIRARVSNKPAAPQAPAPTSAIGPDSVPTLSSQAGTWERDTQAGRM